MMIETSKIKDLCLWQEERKSKMKFLRPLPLAGSKRSKMKFLGPLPSAGSRNSKMKFLSPSPLARSKIKNEIIKSKA